MALLLDTVKKRHNIPQKGLNCRKCEVTYVVSSAATDQIDLCSEDGVVKHLLSHLSAGSGVTFFELRELCLVVRVVPSGKTHLTLFRMLNTVEPIRTPMGQKKVALIVRCPNFKG